MYSVELFAGGGGLAIGIASTGFKHLAIIEYNKDACRTIRTNELFDFGKHLYEGDVREFDYSSIPHEVDLVSGGPPCQPFSLGGKAKGYEDGRDMFPEAVRAVRELKPKAFIFENVKGLLRKSFSDYFEYILLQLQYPSVIKQPNSSWEVHRDELEKYHTHSPHDNLEYRVVHRLVNTADFGVPQKRERVFFIGFRSDIDASWSFPNITHSEDRLLWDKWITGEYWKRHGIDQPTVDEKTIKRASRIESKYGLFPPETLPWVTVRDAICDLPNPSSPESEKWNQHIFKDGARSYPGHTGSYIDEPSKALKAGGHGVPGGENMVRFEDDSIRYFTVRESARIQAFPDDFNFEGSWGEVMRQLGNAVPASIAQIISQSVYEALNSPIRKKSNFIEKLVAN